MRTFSERLSKQGGSTLHVGSTFWMLGLHPEWKGGRHLGTSNCLFVLPYCWCNVTGHLILLLLHYALHPRTVSRRKPALTLHLWAILSQPWEKDPIQCYNHYCFGMLKSNGNRKVVSRECWSYGERALPSEGLAKAQTDLSSYSLWCKYWSNAMHQRPRTGEVESTSRSLKL